MNALRDAHVHDAPISTRETPDTYVVTVSDDGVGFDAFDPRDGRAHIGIANVRERIGALMRGTLAIQSEPGVGTTATITIPKEA